MSEEGKARRIPIVPESERPPNQKFSVSYMNMDADPFQDFNEFCSGKWISENPIPDDKSRWGATEELVERNIFILCKIAEECAFSDNNDRIKRMVGNFYTSAMDTERIEMLRFKPIEKIMSRIDSITETDKIIELIADLHSLGVKGAFTPFSMADEKNSSIYGFYIYQGGLSLPNRDYYLLDSFSSLRDLYLSHIGKMFSLYGYGERESEQNSKTVMEMEKRIAEISRRPEDLRDPERNYNRLPLRDIEDKFKNLNLQIYFKKIGLPESDYVVSGQPEFLSGIDRLLQTFTLEQWKTYFKWQVLHFSAPYLHSDVEKENFDFFRRKLLGQKEQEKRWKTAVKVIDNCIGEALGKLYVESEFGEDSKRMMAEMVDDLMEVFTDRLKNIEWMSSETRQKALEKFRKFRAKIGYPSKFLDYSGLVIESDDYFGNVTRSNSFEFRRQVSRSNRPVDHELWEMTPPTVNAYFNPTGNEIVFPAGILQPPFFDPRMDAPVNYGATGGTIAHEITHGFDDQGRRYDEKGNIKDWWSESDEKAFNSKAKDVITLYDSFEVLPGFHVNGKLTLGENIADIGGVSIAFEALKRRLKKNPEMQRRIDGFTPEQRFFIGWAQSWRSSVRDESLKWLVTSDPHSPEKIRAQVPAMVHEEFEVHFSEFSKLKSTNFKKIRIW
ncbi:MAG: M13 family metallopeptidase [Candidatus Thermoplasmatota archaeon]|nr:M13 family metallopeptidase [Candidatus Thermoplasmatota archaeon]